MKLKHVTKFLDDLFAEPKVDDYSNNGLQVQASEDITKIAFAVDACQETFDRAADAGAQLLFVHHGISWGGGLKRFQGYEAKRMKTLFARGLSLYAQHLPLDMHPELGNNAVLAGILNLQEKIPFGNCDGQCIGMAGTLPNPLSLAGIARILDAKLNTRSQLAVDCGKTIRTVGFISGGGDFGIFEAAQRGLDCLVTGEFRHQNYHPAKEMGVSVVSSGHYATETCGPWAVMEYTRQNLDIPCIFIDIPTGL